MHTKYINKNKNKIYVSKLTSSLNSELNLSSAFAIVSLTVESEVTGICLKWTLACGDKLLKTTTKGT